MAHEHSDDSLSPSGLEMALADIPEALRDTVRRYWVDFAQASEAASLDFPPWSDALLGELCRVWACSEFVARHCVRRPALLQDLLDSGDLARRYAEGDLQQRVQAALHGVSDGDTLARQLRRVRRREMLRIAWRDLAGPAGAAGLQDTMADVSALADACIQGALDWLQTELIGQWGEPQNAAGVAQGLLVLGMGKLGARELNFSSDVDLIFVYPEAGETTKGKSNEQFFARLGQQLVRVLDEQTVDGFVFRVDMRLRPFGQSGALACSFAALEQYYQVHGRDWERYALIKARIVAGDAAQGDQLFHILRPFVFRRYLDYGAFEALREMKQKVAAEVQRKGMANHVKLGPGGIREVEFIGQAFQLVRGGREPALQRRDIQGVLHLLGEHHYLPGYVVEELLAAYVFLRNTEHRLQEFRDQQTHQLPEDEAGRQRLAFAMGFAHWDEFLPALRGHMTRVHSHFQQVFESPQTEHADADESGLSSLWLGEPDDAQAQAILEQAGYDQPAACWARLQGLKSGREYRSLSTTGSRRMDRLMPLLLGAVVALEPRPESPCTVLQRLIGLVEVVARRSAYLALLSEHPMALSQLVRLCAASPWIARQLAQHPLLLDELLDPRHLYQPPKREELAADLQRRLAQIPADDLEQAMDSLRQFKQVSVLRVAAADVMEAVPLSRPIPGPSPSGTASASEIAPGNLVMQVSDHLTAIAELVLQAALKLAWDYLVARHGRPGCVAEEVAGDDGAATGFAIIAYGKLGGIELGYGSDLDLVFLHQADDLNSVTCGARPVADTVFYARLGQRIIHILTAHTPAGVLYETDMRLRPSGASGLLVSSLSSFREYQRHKAWTWEHQALVRARGVAGDAGLQAAFADLRCEVLSLPREPRRLKTEILEMRERMRESLDASTENEFDLKQGSGGIADIEFMVQFAVLRGAHEAPALCEFTDTIRLLAGLAAQGVFSEQDADMLCDAYRAYRAEVHRLALQERPAVVVEQRYARVRANVQRLWRRLFADE
ncbi:MAG TPA: bifunctional [glutamate--ammonia ligase]-adenylyl-L-tyrosine phosphorylase/[glutamate--ammonia-ligase] adenylyltransferase [Gammaproteobacteria bacterium]|nr:bifunctional [glutamate--ammonia ligase]-adenylyl-L-tyrosine phosphorylase/[glutamate--ammonia-ligase] adenylyltransferase [Gammaproteobacteria bacterium]